MTPAHGDDPAHHPLITWATSHLYQHRAHVVPRGDGAALCGSPVDHLTGRRPANHRICPECALLWIGILYPAEPEEPLTDRIR